MLGPILTTLAIVGIGGGALAAMNASWRARMRRQAELGDVAALPPGLGDPRAAFDDLHYVGTSLETNTLERVAISPLGFRGRADVEIHDEGVAIGIREQVPFWIPTAQIRGVRTATGTIDRAVERDGLIAIIWVMTRGTVVESFFRVVAPDQRQAFLAYLQHLADQSPAHVNAATTYEITPEDLA